VIYFHGGSFTHGDKRDIFKDRKRVDDIHFLLKKGIAFASVNYRLLNRLPLEHKGVIKSLYDAKFALQYIRFHANKYNIDPAKIVLWGNSAGASICLWLTVSDDMAKIESNNPIKKESTKVLASVLTETQASLDVFQWETVFQDYEISIPKVIHRNKSFRKRVLQLYGQSNISDLKTESTKRYRERIDSLSKIDSLDPEIWIKNTKTENNYPLNDRGLSLHHPYHAKTIHEHYLSVGAPISAYYGPNSSLFKDPSNENHLDFILRLLE
jgi:carboxylesterase type B